MAFCRNCGRALSDQAVACPQCGHPTARAATTTGQLAGFWMRFAALLIDSLVVGAVSFVLPFVGFVAGFVYSWLMLALNNGQTLGKMALGIRITRPDGTPIDLGTAAVREAMAIVSGLAIGIGYLWAAWDPENRTWHDMVANTRAFVAR